MDTFDIVDLPPQVRSGRHRNFLPDDANLLYLIVQRFAAWDLSPKAIDNYHMGLVFEELIRKFAESSNETAGEHFTPRDIVRLTTALVFIEDDELLTLEGTVRYEIPFNRHFYTYNPPRQLDAIDTELAEVTGEIQELLQEVAGA